MPLRITSEGLLSTYGSARTITLQQFLRELATLERRMQRTLDRFAKGVAEELKREAKEKIGNDFAGLPPYYAGWPPLADATIEDKLRQGYDVPNPLLRSGAFRDSIDTEIESSPGKVVVTLFTTDEAAPYHEMGTINEPPRPVIGPTVFAKMDEIWNTLGEEMVATIVNPEVTYVSGAKAKPMAWATDLLSSIDKVMA